MVEGVHFLAGEDAAIVARRLLAHQPLGPRRQGRRAVRLHPDDRLAAGPRLERPAGLHPRPRSRTARCFDVALLGGDTVSTPGPLTVSATVFGWTPVDGVVPRSGALPRHELVVCGAIGDGYLGLKAARGEIADRKGELAPTLPPAGADAAPARGVARPRGGGGRRLRRADRRRAASGRGQRVRRRARSAADAALGGGQGLGRPPQDKAKALLELASGGDDYALVCAAAEGQALVQAAEACGVQCGRGRRVRTAPGSSTCASRTAA